MVGCRIVQLASWTDQRKVIVPFSNRELLYLSTQLGFSFNRLMLQRSLRMNYRDKPSREIFIKVFTRLMQGPKSNVINQLRVIFNPCPDTLTVRPDLSIHAKPDTIVRYPDEPFYEVQGDHFSLYTHPDEVCRPILNLLGGEGTARV